MLPIAAVIALVIVLTWSTRRRRSYVDPTQVTIDASLAGRVSGLYQQGKKVEAVKLLREQTGLSLADAVTIVEKIAKRSKSGSTSGNTAGVDKAGVNKAGVDKAAATKAPQEKATVRNDPAPGIDASPSTAPVDLDTELEVRSLIADGDKVEAIKLVRARTGWNNSTAKDYVDGL